jgi:hypothetical protein
MIVPTAFSFSSPSTLASKHERNTKESFPFYVQNSLVSQIIQKQNHKKWEDYDELWDGKELGRRLYYIYIYSK